MDWPQAVTNATIMMTVARALSRRKKYGNPSEGQFLTKGVRRQYKRLWSASVDHPHKNRDERKRVNVSHLWIELMENRDPGAPDHPLQRPEALVVVYRRLKEHFGYEWKSGDQPEPEQVGKVLDELWSLVDAVDVHEVIRHTTTGWSVLGEPEYNENLGTWREPGQFWIDPTDGYQTLAVMVIWRSNWFMRHFWQAVTLTSE